MDSFLMVCLRFVLGEEIQNVVYADSSSAMNWGYSKGLWQGSLASRQGCGRVRHLLGKVLWIQEKNQFR